MTRKTPNFLREVNERIRGVATMLGVGRSERSLGFVCECGDPGCHALVHLSTDEYDGRDGTRSLTADGHG
jgi:hypothetical protein